MDKKIKHPFITTDSYFEELKEDILSNTPGYVLDKYNTKNIYTVPDDFFEQQYLNILDKKSSQPSPLFPAFNTKKALVWATTAVSTVLLIVFSYSYFATKELDDLLRNSGKNIPADVTNIQDKISTKHKKTDTITPGDTIAPSSK